MVRIVNFYQFQFLQNKQREQNKTKVEFKDYNPQFKEYDYINYLLI